MISPQQLASLLGPLLLNSHNEYSRTPFCDAVVDSRRARPDALFIALRGEHTDGHYFVGDAMDRGATGLLCRFVADSLPASDRRDDVTLFQVEDPLAALQAAAKQWREQHAVRVVSLTGSVGKTTTREAVAQMLARRAPTLESPFNYNSEIGLPLSLLRLEPQHTWAVLEMGPYDLREISLLCEIAQPEIGIVTNVGPTHLERFGSIEAIEEAKGILPASLPADGLAVLNADDPRTLCMRNRTSARVLTFGRTMQADVRATDEASQGLDGISFTLNFEGQSAAVRTSLVGIHHVMTALAAAAVALGAGWTLAETAEALSMLHAGQRLKPRRSYSGALILDDTYNAAPLSVQAALDLLAELPGQRIAVLGDMLELGSEETAGHRAVGAYAVGRCDRLVAIGELGKITADAAWDAGHRQIQWFEDKEPATQLLRQELGADDIVLIKASHAQELETVVEALITP